ncbi:uncharacterized protein LOC135468760 [Liolophura sinensis]|uniref:uncharacterized protein LOC135468760 n=1 Tax=Liolophura sinensis TaxID=3198878 RepID=UPI003158E828
MEQTIEFWLNIVIPILMSAGLISTLVILWKYNIEISVEKIDNFLQLFKREENGEKRELIKTEESLTWSVSFNQGSAGPRTTCSSSTVESTSNSQMYGAIPKHMDAIPKHTGAIPKHIGTMPKHLGAIPKNLGGNT